MRKMGYLAVALIGTTLLFSGCKKEELIKFDDYSQFKEIQTSDYITIGQYKYLTISKDTISVSDLEIEEKIASELYNHGYYVETNDSPVSTGTRVTITMSGTIDGKINDGFTADDFEFVYGQDEYVMDGFTANLEGNFSGDRVKFEMVIPGTFQQAEFVGKTVEFSVLIKKVESYYIPGLDEAFLQEAANCSTLEEYKEYLIPIIKEDKLQSIVDDKISGVWKVISDGSEVIEYPEGSIDAMETKLENQLNVYAMVNGMDIETFIKNYYGITYEEYVKLALKQELLLDAIGRKEGITLTADEYQKALKNQASANGYNSVEALLKNIDEDQAKQAILWQKTKEFLAEQATIINE